MSVFALARSYLLHFLLVSLTTGLQWPVVQQGAPETLPSIELALAPPARPMPQVAAELGNLEGNRERIENAKMRALQKGLNEAVRTAQQRIGESFGRFVKVLDDPQHLTSKIFPEDVAAQASEFRQIPQETLRSKLLSVRVNVLPASSPDPALRSLIDNMEHQRGDAEKKMLNSAVDELKSLTDFVVNELDAQLHLQISRMLELPPATLAAHRQKQVDFMEDGSVQLPAQSNVRVVPGDVKYPTLSTMVEDMENRRDSTEDAERLWILDRELDLLMECNDAIKEGLSGVTERLVAQHSRLLAS